MRKLISAALFILIAVQLCGCMGRTGKIGMPITERHQERLDKLELGKSTPDDLEAIFGKEASLKETRVEAGNRVEIWEVFRGGNVDVAQFLLWGQIAHDKDQSLLFRFENGRLVSYKGVVHEDAD